MIKLLLVIFIFCNCYLFAESLPQMDDRFSFENRKDYALEMEKKLQKILDSIPSLSPEKKQWIIENLEKYKKSKNYSIMLEIEKSKEFKIYNAIILFNNLKYYIDLITKELSIKKSNNNYLEMYYWSSFMYYLDDPNRWLDVYSLIEESIIPGNLLTEQWTTNPDRFREANSSFVINSINRKIIMNYFLRKSNVVE